MKRKASRSVIDSQRDEACEIFICGIEDGCHKRTPKMMDCVKDLLSHGYED